MRTINILCTGFFCLFVFSNISIAKDNDSRSLVIAEGKLETLSYEKMNDMRNELVLSGVTYEKPPKEGPHSFCKVKTVVEWGFTPVKELLVHWVRFRCGRGRDSFWFDTRYRVVPTGVRWQRSHC